MTHFRSRREFLAAMAAAPVLLHGEHAFASAITPVRIAPLSEPGEQIVVSGVVYHADGVTPAAGARLFAYHVDRFGIYAKGSDEPKNIARLKAYFSADDQGRYSFATIRPASYPDSTTSAHIHVHAAVKGTSDSDLFQYPFAVPNFLFEGDRFLSSREAEAARAAGRFNNVLRLTPRSGGGHEGTRHIKLGRT